jgi:hypothetical protein
LRIKHRRWRSWTTALASIPSMSRAALLKPLNKAFARKKCNSAEHKLYLR